MRKITADEKMRMQNSDTLSTLGTKVLAKEFASITHLAEEDLKKQVSVVLYPSHNVKKDDVKSEGLVKTELSDGGIQYKAKEIVGLDPKLQEIMEKNIDLINALQEISVADACGYVPLEEDVSELSAVLNMDEYVDVIAEIREEERKAKEEAEKKKKEEEASEGEVVELKTA